MGIRNLILVGLGELLLGCLTLAILALFRGSANCPYCLSPRVRSSWPTVGDRLLYLIYLRPYRCHACRNRFHAMKRRRVVTSVHAHSLSTDKRARAAGGLAREATIVIETDVRD